MYAKFVKEYVLTYSDDGKSWTMFSKVTRDLWVVIKAASTLSKCRKHKNGKNQGNGS